LDQAVIRTQPPAAIAPRRGMVLAAALMATAMTAVESSIVATATPTIVGDLGGFRLFSGILWAACGAFVMGIGMGACNTSFRSRSRRASTGASAVRPPAATCSCA
jgi:hypothetical protein